MKTPGNREGGGDHPGGLIRAPQGCCSLFSPTFRESRWYTLLNMIIFKAIDGYPRYEVSNKGQVRRVEDGSLLEGGLSSQGYPKVKLTNEDGDRRNENVHVLMARAFYGVVPGGYVTHLNGNKTDNRLGNLRYVVSDPVQAQAAYQALSAKRRKAPR